MVKSNQVSYEDVILLNEMYIIPEVTYEEMVKLSIRENKTKDMLIMYGEFIFKIIAITNNRLYITSINNPTINKIKYMVRQHD